METKNTIIQTYAKVIADASNTLVLNSGFTNVPDEDKAIIKTLCVGLETLRAHIVLMQQALDDYNK